MAAAAGPSISLARARADYARLQEEESMHAASNPFNERRASAFVARLQEEESIHAASNPFNERRASAFGSASSPAAQTRLSASVAEKLRRARQLSSSLRSPAKQRGHREDETSARLDALARRAERAQEHASPGLTAPPSDDAASPNGRERGAPSRATPPSAARAQIKASAEPAAVLGDGAASSPRRWSFSGDDVSPSARAELAAAPPSAWEVLSYRLDLFLSRSSSKYLLLAMLLALGLAAGTLALYPFVMGGELDGGGYGDDDDGGGALRALPRAFWLTWTFMADPGAHAEALDGHSAGLRLVGAGVACLGILLASTVVALIVDAVHHKVEALTAGSLRVPESGHVLVLGWSARAVSLLVELCEANASMGGGVVVVISDARSKREMEDEAGFALDADRLKGTRILFRHGVPHLLPTLTSVRAHAAKAIVVLADPTVPAGVSDAATLRTVLSLRTLACAPRGHVVAEANLVDCEPALELVGAALVETVVADTIVGRLLVVCAQNAGLAECYESLLGFCGDELYLKEWPQLVGATFGEAARRFEHAVVVGVRHAREPGAAAPRAARARAPSAERRVSINPADSYVLRPGDELVVIAQDDDSYAPSPAAEPLPAHLPSPSRARAQQPQQLLIVGWRHSLPAMLSSLAELVAAGSVVHVLAEEPLASRNSASLDLDLAHIEPDGRQLVGRRLTALHHVGSAIKRHHLSRLPVECCDSILILANGGAADPRGATDALQSDSASLASLLLCWDVASAARERLARTGERSPSPSSGRRALAQSAAARALSAPFAPKRAQAEQQILCEILDFRTRDILRRDASVVSRFDFLLSNSVMSKVLAMVAEERALRQILLELLQPAGSEMLVRPYAEFEPELRPLAERLSFWDLAFFMRRRGEILIGYKRAREMPVFNPPDKRAPLRLTRADSVVVLSPADTVDGQPTP